MPTVHASSTEPKIPVPRTPLVGRERERSAVAALLQSPNVPLVTLTGPGGVGKTRLAQQIASDLASAFDGNVRFVPLAAIQEADLVLAAVAQAVGLEALGGQSPRDGLLTYFGVRKALLVIDNFEQVMPAAGDLSVLLEHCPGLTMLATSREPLHISGEHEFPVSPLDVPRKPEDAIARSTAVELFVQRGRAVKPGFDLTDDNAGAIADICIRLDGLPLAIELAASRVKVFSPQAIQERLTDRLALLSRDGRDVPNRLRSMRDAVGWSYDLLSDDERRLFRRLSVLPGGCWADNAAAVSGLSPEESGEMFLERLISLAEKSLLVQVDRPSGQPRFRMLETIRSYGLEQLDAHGETAAAIEGLKRWLIARTEYALEQQWAPLQAVWSEFFDAEIDNVRAALDWCLAHDDLDSASHLLAAVARYLHIRGHFAEAVTNTNRVFALEKRLGPSRHLARIEVIAGWHYFHIGEMTRARELLNASLEHCVSPDDDLSEAYCHHILGVLDEVDGEFDHAVHRIELALAYYRRSDNRTWQAQALNSLGYTNFARGRVDLAADQLEEAFQTLEQDDTYTTGAVLINLGRVARHRGDYRLAQSLLVQSLRLHWDHRNRYGMIGSLRGLGQTCVRTGEPETAAQLFGAVDGLREAIGARYPEPRPAYLQTVERLRRQLGDERFALLWTEGRAMPLDKLVEQEIARADTEAGLTGANQQKPSSNELTARELEVLQLIYAGNSNREISEALFISERTAQTHVQHILSKLGVSTRTAAAVRATELRLI
jgi:non-specific serine/threonine protein kinase